MYSASLNSEKESKKKKLMGGHYKFTPDKRKHIRLKEDRTIKSLIWFRDYEKIIDKIDVTKFKKEAGKSKLKSMDNTTWLY